MKRVRVGLRLMLLIVALFAVLFAWVGARRERQRIDARGELRRFEVYREYLAKSSAGFSNEKDRRAALARMDALIAERRQRLGNADR
jgi:hypothetical protein